jgi:hypothetical protein
MWLFAPEHRPMLRRNIQPAMGVKQPPAFRARPLNALLVPVAVPVFTPVSIPCLSVKLIVRFLRLRYPGQRKIIEGECVPAKPLPQPHNKSL